MKTKVASYSDMPTSNTATILYGLIRGITPIGVVAPFGCTRVTLSPARNDNWSASRRPIATPSVSSKPSSVPCLILLPIEGSRARSSPRMPRTRTPVELNGEDASAWPSTTGDASMTPSILAMRAATSFQSVSGDSSGWISR